MQETIKKTLINLQKTIKSIYGNKFGEQPPTDRKQFHLNLYGPVLNRLNMFIQQLKTKAAESEQLDMKNIYEIMVDTNIMFKVSIILYERYLNPINMEAFFIVVMNILSFAAAHQTEIIDGLQAVENIIPRVLDLCLTLSTKLLVVARAVLQTFFGFFAIQFNMIYRNVIANTIWATVSSSWLDIISAILTLLFPIRIVFGILSFIYNQHMPRTEPAAINANIDGDDLLIG